jgi:hypothetical protein
LKFYNFTHYHGSWRKLVTYDFYLDTDPYLFPTYITQGYTYIKSIQTRKISKWSQKQSAKNQPINQKPTNTYQEIKTSKKSWASNFIIIIILNVILSSPSPLFFSLFTVIEIYHGGHYNIRSSWCFGY